MLKAECSFQRTSLSVMGMHVRASTSRSLWARRTHEPKRPMPPSQRMSKSGENCSMYVRTCAVSSSERTAFPFVVRDAGTMSSSKTAVARPLLTMRCHAARIASR